MPAKFLEKLLQDSNSGIDMAALDILWDLKGRMGDFRLVQVEHDSAALKHTVSIVLVGLHTSIRNGNVVMLIGHQSQTQGDVSNIR